MLNEAVIVSIRGACRRLRGSHTVIMVAEMITQMQDLDRVEWRVHLLNHRLTTNLMHDHIKQQKLGEGCHLQLAGPLTIFFDLFEICVDLLIILNEILKIVFVLFYIFNCFLA
jgi:hypothetical protein